MENYEWKYYSLGGVTRVSINSGEDIANLENLDQKLWTVLSCPIDGLAADEETLKLIDSDKDGKIKVPEVIAASKWLTSRIKNKDLILKGDDTLPLDEIADDKLRKSAKHILNSLGARKSSEISLAQASDSTKIFSGTKFNGDGIITCLSTDEPALKQTIADMIACSQPKIDRSGENGVDDAIIEQFYADCAAYSEWKANEKNAEIFPYGANTQSVIDLVCELKPKVEEFFTRCKLLKFDEKTAESVAISISSLDEIAQCPLAAPNPEGVLKLDAINPAYQELTEKLRATLELKDTLAEAQWNEINSKLSSYTAWISAKTGTSVEPLGIDRVNTILSENNKESLLQLIAQDKELEAESNSIDEVKHLMMLYKHFYNFLNNYISFTDFYKREQRAMFEAGQLYIDQRCCDLCIKVEDMGKHADMAALSGMFLIYCTCTNKKIAKTMNIVAVMTDGSITNIRPGKNGIFYDCDGDDWDAVITKIVDNPISIKSAFWSPYRKFWEFCVGLINKSAEDKEKKVSADLQAKATEATDTTAKQGEAKPIKMPFDIAKFAGIFAAIGLALGSIGSFLAQIASGVAANPLNLVWGILAIVIVISGPSCFIAWSKLRKRNLGPILNANGWAINSKVKINIMFGAKLTSVANYPKSIVINDPYIKKKTAWRWIIPTLILLIAAFIILVCTDVIVIDSIGIFQKR